MHRLFLHVGMCTLSEDCALLFLSLYLFVSTKAGFCLSEALYSAMLVLQNMRWTAYEINNFLGFAMFSPVQHSVRHKVPRVGKQCESRRSC